MTEIRVLILALKFLGVYCVIRALEYLSPFLFSFVWAVRTSTGFSLILGWIAPFGLLLITAFVLIRYSETIVRRLFPSSESILIVIQGPEIQWYSLAFTLMGIILLIQEIPILISSLISNLSVQNSMSGSESQTQIARGTSIVILQLIVKIPAGLFLMFGSKRIAKFFISM